MSEATLSVNAAPEPTSPPHSDHQGEALRALEALILSSEAFRRAVADRFNLGLLETVALTHLSSPEGQLTPRELAKRLRVRPSTITTLLDRLEAAGLTMRSPHPTDRRRVLVTTTPQAEAMLAEVQQYLGNAITQAVPDQLLTTAQTLEALAAALGRQADLIGLLAKLTPEAVGHP